MENYKEMIRVALLLLTLVSSGSCLAQTEQNSDSSPGGVATLHQDPKNPTYYYGTWFDATYCYTAPEGTEVWYAKEIDNGVIRLEKGSDNTIYSNCGVILRSTSQSNSKTIEVTFTDRRTIAGHSHTSALTGTSGSAIKLDHNTYYYYVLNATPEHGVGFYKISSDYIAAFKAYFEVAKNNTSAAHSMLVFDFDDSTTGIDGVKSVETYDNRYYNLAGQYVAHPTKGIYIVNGKKVIVK